MAEDDQYRQLTGEHELSDLTEHREAELGVIEPDAAETNVPYVRTSLPGRSNAAQGQQQHRADASEPSRGQELAPYG